MPKASAVNVVRRGPDWAVVRDNGKRASGVFDTQAEAIDAGRQIAKNNETELRIQGLDTRWRSVDSYGNDPNPPTDREH